MLPDFAARNKTAAKRKGIKIEQKKNNCACRNLRVLWTLYYYSKIQNIRSRHFPRDAARSIKQCNGASLLLL
jgi:hypothetical protein